MNLHSTSERIGHVLSPCGYSECAVAQRDETTGLARLGQNFQRTAELECDRGHVLRGRISEPCCFDVSDVPILSGKPIECSRYTNGTVEVIVPDYEAAGPHHRRR